MAAQISQETFDAVVKENMEEFEMEAEEALNEAVEQFQAQGVNLANIVKDLSLYTSAGGEGGEPAKHPVVAAVEHLKKECDKQPVDNKAVQDAARNLQAECDTDLARRCLAGKNNAYPSLLAACTQFQADADTLRCLLSTFCSLCNGQPDLLDEEGITWNCHAIRTADADSSCADICELLVKFMRLNCTKHERNRQKYVASDIIALLSTTMDKFKTNSAVLKEVCGALRVLTYDDDVRVPFGKGHEHAKMIVTEQDALSKIMLISKDFRDDEPLLGELYQTLSCLAVRNEFCQQIMDLGGVGLMLDTIAHNPNNQGLVKQVLRVLKTIAGNDDVKVAIVGASGIELIVSALSQYALSAPIAEAGCAALTALALRNPSHSNRIMAASGAEVIVKAMQIHADKPAVQKQACMAVRNVVARNKEHIGAFVERGVEELIHRAMRAHPEACGDEGRAALRDLELKVELRAPWTGEGKGIKA